VTNQLKSIQAGFLVLAAMLSAPVFAVSGQGSPSLQGAPKVCSANAQRARRLELGDGRILSVDVQSLARSGESVMAVGRHAYVFPATAQSRTSPTLRDSIIGVVVDDRGKVALVSNPMLPRNVYYPRAAAGPNGSFHVLFATAADSIPAWPTPSDTASIWYARFENGMWSKPERAASVRGAPLQSEVASDLLERNGQLSFLFPFRDDSNATTEGGVILLRRQTGRWSADTLRTYFMPAAVRAVHAPRGESIAALLSLNGLSGDRNAEALFLARFDSRWGSPSRLAGNGVHPVAVPILATLGNGLVASWVSWRFMHSDSTSMGWLRVDAGDRISLRPVVDSGEATFPFEMIVVDDKYPLWLYHGSPFGSSAKLVMAIDSTVVRLADVVLPFWNPRTRTIALTGTRFLVFTQKRATADNEPMAASYATVLEIRCPRSERR